MRTTNVVLSLFLIAFLGSATVAAASPQASADEKLFQDAKLLIFDKKWEPSLDKIQELLNSHPKSPYYGQALFYKGECLGSLKGREREALQVYKEYIRLPGANASLVEESEGAIVDLAYELYDQGDKSAVRDIEERLSHPNEAVQFFAAYKLSLVRDKAVAAKAVPVLKRYIQTAKEPELADRARIALLRISPESLKSAEEQRSASESMRVLKIRVWKRGMKEPTVSLNIPWSLADLALGAMSDEDKAAMRRKGYDINRVIDDLVKYKDKYKEKPFRIEAEDGTIIEIWIE